MASKEDKEINEQLKNALDEVGKIQPWYNKDFKTWVFFHELYPVEYSGDTKEEVIKNYPLYLREFIKHRLQDKLSSIMEKKTKGHGGKRTGAGRPKKIEEEKKVRIYLPKDIAFWIKQPEVINDIRHFVRAYRT